jgi:hypothetical protein
MKIGLVSCSVRYKKWDYSRAWGHSTNIQIVVGVSFATAPCAARVVFLGLTKMHGKQGAEHPPCPSQLHNSSLQKYFTFCFDMTTYCVQARLKNFDRAASLCPQ